MQLTKVVYWIRSSEYLSGLGFSWADIAQFLRVSCMTVYRCQELGMIGDQLTLLLDDQLERELVAMRRDHPEYNETMASEFHTTVYR